MLKVSGEARPYNESFDAQQYLALLRRRWRFIGGATLAAGLLALIASLVIPKEYTASATLMIDPPAGNDPRISITVSPVYLESLRAYETVASGDSLFLRALDKFHLRDSRPVETIKRRILKVSKVRDTKVLQIEVTLPDPRQAQAIAQFLAEETVNLTRTANLDGDNGLVIDARGRAVEAKKRLEQEQTAWQEFSLKEPYETMRADVEALTDARDRVQRDLLDARANLAELTTGAPEQSRASARARVVSLESQDAELGRQLQARGAQLSGRAARAEVLEQRLKSALADYDSAAQRVREAEATAGMRGERLRVIDPGVVPERPSFPNLGLNVILAIAVALIASVTYVTIAFRP